MARRFKARARRSFRRFRKRSGGGTGGFMSSPVTSAVIGGGLYGAARGYVNNLISPLTSKIPAGQYADNVAMGIVNYFVYRYSSGLIKKTALTGLAIEAAMAGSEMTSGMTQSSTNNQISWTN
jgi:hypothetical protein